MGEVNSPASTHIQPLKSSRLRSPSQAAWRGAVPLGDSQPGVSALRLSLASQPGSSHHSYARSASPSTFLLPSFVSRSLSDSLSKRCSLMISNGGSSTGGRAPRLTRNQVRLVTDEDIGLKVLRDPSANTADVADATKIVECVHYCDMRSPRVILTFMAASSRSTASVRTQTIAGASMSAQQRARSGSTGSRRRTCYRQSPRRRVLCDMDTNRNGLEKRRCGRKCRR
jgi:hypothetical protein